MEENNWLHLAMEHVQVPQILKTNSYSMKYGLILTEQDAALLVEKRKEALEATKRVEFGQSILPKIIYEFCDSDYICQTDYVETLTRLQEIFFHYKNEMQDEVTDDELLHFMKEQFETVCFGDLEYLESTCLDIFAQAVRAGYRGYQKTEGKGEYGRLDEVPRWDRKLYLETLKELCWR